MTSPYAEVLSGVVSGQNRRNPEHEAIRTAWSAASAIAGLYRAVEFAALLLIGSAQPLEHANRILAKTDHGGPPGAALRPILPNKE